MPLPPKVTKFDRNGVTYVSSVDRVNYSIQELTRGALRDVGIFVLREANKGLQTLPGMKRSRRVRGKYSPFEKWVRSKSCDLQVGIKPDKKWGGAWYGEQQELGSSKMPKKAFLRNAVYNNIPKIVEIESKYLSALEDDAAALNMIESIEDGDISGGADD